MGPDAKQTCTDLGEHHHWTANHVPGLKIGYIVQCSICGVYNAHEMNLTIAILEQQAVKEYLRREYEWR